MDNCNIHVSQMFQKPQQLNSVNFLLINFNHFKAAVTVAVRFMEENFLNIALLQDTYYGGEGGILFVILTA